MRKQLEKLRKGHSTKAERIFSEILKELHIPFKTKVKILDREVDFLVNNLAIEIDGHPQLADKNGVLLEIGIIPIHFDNKEVKDNPQIIKEEIISLMNYYGNKNNKD